MTFVLVAVVAVVAWVSIPGLTARIPKLPARRKKERGARRREIDMGMVLTQVATRLRSGQSAPSAWRQTLDTYGLHANGPRGADSDVLDSDGVPYALVEAWRAPRWRQRRMGITKITAETLPATFAVCRMSYTTGAPMADVLESCARGMTESGESRSARDVALAGPETSAHMLAALPIVGILLGAIAGIDPLAFFTTSIGRIVLIAGLFLEGVGIYLTLRFVRSAREAEDIE